MTNKNFTIWDLEKHQSRAVTDSHINGELTVIWRDWDNLIKNHPKMVYVNSVNPGEVKGPHIHKNRTSYFYCIHGTIILVIQDRNGEYHEIEANSEKPILVSVSNGVAAAIVKCVMCGCLCIYGGQDVRPDTQTETNNLHLRQ